jgi:hypothetical protein
MKKIKLPFQYRYSPDGCTIITIGPGDAEIHDEFYDRAIAAIEKVAPKKRGRKKGPEFKK